jgi:hypothetical protein
VKAASDLISSVFESPSKAQFGSTPVSTALFDTYASHSFGRSEPRKVEIVLAALAASWKMPRQAYHHTIPKIQHIERGELFAIARSKKFRMVCTV